MPHLLALLACVPSPEPTPPAPRDRAAFNQGAVEHGVPVFWLDDTNGSGRPDPDEVVSLWGPGPSRAFTADELAGLGDGWDAPPADARQAALQQELRQGRVTVVLTEVEAADRPFVDAMLEVGRAIEVLHRRQNSSAIPADDALSQAVYFRNQVPWCVQTGTDRDPECRATLQPTPREYGVYDTQPPDCAALEAAGLMDPFTAVRDQRAVPYPEAWPAEMAAVRERLLAAVATLGDDEGPMRAYLTAAADAFASNDWFAADAAWAKTTVENSRWYIRVGPDETYWDPCDRKAGFHLVFSRVDPASAKWKAVLEPLRDALEGAVAAHAGPPYVAREVRFQLPDFIDIVLNAGDSRSPTGATVGQSLPNWGPVAEAGGRTVAMTNLNLDPDSVASKRAQAASLLCELGPYTDDPEPLLVSTVLHEVAHNLGPAAGYTVDGRTDEQIFGGELSTMLEELKAQTAALYLTDWLVAQGRITPEFGQQAHQADLVWAFGKIADGMTDADGHSEPYPQLAAIQLGLLLESGAVRWEARPAANGTDTGCFAVDHAAMPAAIEAMASAVFGIKARGDRAAGEALRARFTEGSPHFAVITERWRRAPTASFVYGVR